jgi:hypothetical protein
MFFPKTQILATKNLKNHYMFTILKKNPFGKNLFQNNLWLSLVPICSHKSQGMVKEVQGTNVELALLQNYI